MQALFGHDIKAQPLLANHIAKGHRVVNHLLSNAPLLTPLARVIGMYYSRLHNLPTKRRFLHFSLFLKDGFYKESVVG